MYFPRQTKKDCVRILHICKLNALTQLHVKQDAGKNALKERKNAKRKNNSCRMFPAPEPATNNPHNHTLTGKALLPPQQSTATAPRMPHRAHEKGNRYNSIHG